ncbi:MAG: hypothetical protein JXR86_03245 [Spirochaetales bacterium]|nr:hypothetical protein [Spirochaetales bacterium]
MTDILYCESSGLLASSFEKWLESWSCRHLADPGVFWETLSETSPRLILMGDSFSSRMEELIFCLKSRPDCSNIPVVLLSEKNPGSHIPVNLWVSRFDPDEQDFKLKISRLLYRNNKTGEEKPLALQKKGCGNTLKKGLEQRIFLEYAGARLEGVPIAGSTLEKVIETLLRRTAALTGCDFTYLEFRGGEREVRHLHCGGFWSEEIRKKIMERCRQKQPASFGPVEAEWTCSFEQNFNSGGSGDISVEVIIGTVMDGNPWFSAYLACGNLSSGTKNNGAAKLAPLISDKCSRTLELAVRHFNTELETETLYRAFTRFLPAPIIEDLLVKTSEKDLMTGEKRKIVVLFSHIRNFDYIAEHNSAENIVRFLNQHFTSMGSIIKEQGGTIDKFIGDAIFAIFGAPISYTDNCERAARAAKEMIETYRKNNTSFMKLPPEGFHIGVGLNEGVAIIGNIGCSVKFDYTAIGDTVNLAARLESLCKHYHRHILISEVMYHQLKNDYFCRLVDVARVKGKTEPSRIYSLETEPDLFPERWRELYQKGLSMYLMGNWYLAIQYLEEALEILPEDFPTGQFLDRCEEYRSAPPDRWDGAVTLNFK